jgi:hypothetical protein
MKKRFIILFMFCLTGFLFADDITVENIKLQYHINILFEDNINNEFISSHFNTDAFRKIDNETKKQECINLCMRLITNNETNKYFKVLKNIVFFDTDGMNGLVLNNQSIGINVHKENSDLFGVINHEFFHILQSNYSAEYSEYHFDNIYNTNHNILFQQYKDKYNCTSILINVLEQDFDLLNKNGFISWYASTNKMDMTAELYREYITDNKKLKKLFLQYPKINEQLSLIKKFLDQINLES